MFEIHIETNWPEAKLSPTAHLVPPNVLDGLNNPYQFGYAAGEKWVKTASIDAIDAAATRMTTNQQLEMYFDYYHKQVEEGKEGIDGNIFITYPTQRHFGYGKELSREISDYFKNLKFKYFYFNGDADSTTDEEVCSKCGDNFGLTDVPNKEFRLFEDGWTEAVRDYYKIYLLDRKKSRE
jgi:hypothetical protein